MRKNIFKTSLVIGFISLFTLTACFNNSVLDTLSNHFSSSVDLYGNIDNIASEDLAPGLFTSLKAEDSKNVNVINLSSFEVLDKVKEVIKLQEELREKQSTINQNKEEFKIAKEDFKNNIKSFKDKKLTLTLEEEELLKGYINEIKTINSEFKGTIGKVYLKIYNLRGKINLKNLDVIISTYESVNQQMDIRVNGSNRLMIIINDINLLISNKVAQ